MEMNMNMKKVVLFMVLIINLSLLGGCAGTGGGLNSISKTNKLMPGMSTNNVKNILGDPSQTQFISEKWVWKYSLHQVWKGFVPYYLIFGKEDQKLKSWYADEAEYMRQQQLWLQVIPPTQKHEVKVKVQ
jgi:hypothetical protein